MCQGHGDSCLSGSHDDHLGSLPTGEQDIAQGRGPRPRLSRQVWGLEMSAEEVGARGLQRAPVPDSASSRRGQSGVQYAGRQVAVGKLFLGRGSLREEQGRRALKKAPLLELRNTLEQDLVGPLPEP